MSIARIMLVMLMVASLGVVTPAMAQSGVAGAQEQPPTNQPVDSDVLAGPSVEDEASEGSDNMMGRGQRRRVESLPLRQWLQQVRGLDLTQQQQQSIASIMQELEQAQQAFRAEHSEQMRQLQETLGQMRRGGREPDPALREQLQKLEADMPVPTDYQRRIWDALTAEQQERLRERIAELEQRLQQQGQRRRDGARGGAAAPGRAEGSAPEMNGDAPKPETPASGMTPDTGDVMAPPAGQVPGNRDAAQQQRRRLAAAGGGLDDLARRRVEFLRQFVSPSSPSRTRVGDGPTSEQRTFKFEE